MIRTKDEKLRLAEAAVVQAAVRAYKTHKAWLDGDVHGPEFCPLWDAQERAQRAERVSVEKLLRLRGKP